MCFICSKVKGYIFCTAFVNIAFLCANQENSLFGGMECNSSATSCKINRGTQRLIINK